MLGLLNIFTTQIVGVMYYIYIADMRLSYKRIFNFILRGLCFVYYILLALMLAGNDILSTGQSTVQSTMILLPYIIALSMMNYSNAKYKERGNNTHLNDIRYLGLFIYIIGILFNTAIVLFNYFNIYLNPLSLVIVLILDIIISLGSLFYLL